MNRTSRKNQTGTNRMTPSRRSPAHAREGQIVIVDCDHRRLVKTLNAAGVPVLDRTGVIIEFSAARARERLGCRWRSAELSRPRLRETGGGRSGWGGESGQGAEMRSRAR